MRSTLLQATQHEPLLAEGWYELGRAHMRVREWKLALAALERASQQGLDTVEGYNVLASCYLKTGKKAAAKKMVQEALRRDPGNADAVRLQKQV